MPSSNICWGVEVGAGAIKAVRLERNGASARVMDWAVIPHKKPLSTPDVDQADALRVAIGTLIAEKSLKGATVAVSVPGHMGFTRFAKLPPVEPKKVPDIVKFEAVQQIPFPIDQVEWDYQTFASQDSPDVEVGIFAITRDRVMERLALLADVGVSPQVVTLSPVAAYNALAFDLSFTEKTAGLVVLDIGAVATDLIVADMGRVWVRTFPIGGHHFTECLVNAFKLNYAKAEKLKREVEQSQHKRQVFQAMRPVFEDLATDVQRSIAYYQQLHPESKLERLVGLGATFGLPGLKKFLGQRLQLDVARLEQFHRIAVEGADGAEFQSSAHVLCTAYGCALQGLGLAPIDANLVPVAVVRQAMWKRKTPWFAAAAGLSLAAGAAAFVKPLLESGRLPRPQAEARNAVASATSLAGKLKQEWSEANKSVRIGHAVSNITGLFENRTIYAHALDDLGQMFATVNAQPELLAGPESASKVPPAQWRWLELKSFRIVSGAASAPETRAGRGRRDAEAAAAPAQGPTLRAVLVVESPNADKIKFINATIVKWLEANKERPGVPYKIIPPDPTRIPAEPVKPPDSTGAGAGPGAGGPLEALAPLPASTPVFPKEAEVFRYTITWGLDTGAPPPAPDGGAQPAGAPGEPGGSEAPPAQPSGRGPPRGRGRVGAVRSRKERGR